MSEIRLELFRAGLDSCRKPQTTNKQAGVGQGRPTRYARTRGQKGRRRTRVRLVKLQPGLFHPGGQIPILQNKWLRHSWGHGAFLRPQMVGSQRRNASFQVSRWTPAFEFRVLQLGFTRRSWGRGQRSTHSSLDLEEERDLWRERTWTGLNETETQIESTGGSSSITAFPGSDTDRCPSNSGTRAQTEPELCPSSLC